MAPRLEPIRCVYLLRSLAAVPTPRELPNEPTRANFTAAPISQQSFGTHQNLGAQKPPHTPKTNPPHLPTFIKLCAAYPVYRLVLVTPRHDMGRPAVVDPAWVDTYGISNAGTRTGEPASRTERRGGADSDMEAAREPGRGRREGGWAAQAVWAGDGKGREGSTFVILGAAPQINERM